MIAITAGAGTTGRHILRALSSAGFAVRALIHTDTHSEAVRSDGAHQAVVADMTHPDELPAALDGCSAVVHIGPPMHPREITMSHNVIDAAVHAGIEHVVLMSVTHPQLEPLLNHQSKLAAERHLLASRLPFTILQPMHYMQNVRVRECVTAGIFTQPFSLDRPLSFVDLTDVGAVAARVLSNPQQHRWATYELCGTDTLTAHEVAAILTDVSGTAIHAEQIPITSMINEQAPDYTIDGFTRLANHYDRYGILGNPNVLRWLLGHEPTTFTQYTHNQLN